MNDPGNLLSFLGAVALFTIGLRHAEDLPYLTAGAAGILFLVALVMVFPGIAPSGLLTAALVLLLSATILPRRRRSDIVTGLGLALTGAALAWDIATTGSIPFHPIPTAVPGFVTGIVLSALYKSSAAVVLIAMLLTTAGEVSLVGTLSMVIGANGINLVSGWIAVRRAGNGSISKTSDLHQNAIHLTAILLGCALAPVMLVSGVVISAPAPALAGFHLIVHGIAAFLYRKNRWLHAWIASRVPAAPPAAVTPESLDSKLDRVRSTLVEMADRASEMLMVVINASQLDDEIPAATDRIIELRGQLKRREEQIAGILTVSVQLPCTHNQAERIQQQQRIAQELSLVGDDCYKTTRLFARSHRKHYRFHRESRDELFDFTSQILDFLRYIGDYLQGRITNPDWELANRMEDTIDSVRDKLKKRSRNVLERNDDADIRGELAFIDIVAHLEHVGDRCQSIADTVRHIPGR